ncbi:hypothetical protein SH139x_000695 [Planctomycetaceae bacterium SH139]
MNDQQSSSRATTPSRGAKLKPNPGRERLKVVLAVVLAGVLGFLLLPGGDSSSDDFLSDNFSSGNSSGDASLATAGGTVTSRTTPSNRLRNAGKARSPQTPAGEEAIIDPKTTEPAQRSAIKLPRMDLATIAEHDPFSLASEKLPRVAQLDEQQTDAAADDQQPASGALPLQEVRAVYATSGGGAALVGGRVVPVSDPRKLIRQLRADN